MALPKEAYPGLALAPSATHLAGPGTHVYNGRVTASIVGTPTLTPPASASRPSAQQPPSSTSKASGTARSTVSVTPLRPTISSAPFPSRHVAVSVPPPTIGSTVLARVIRLHTSAATLALLVVDGAVCGEPPAHGTVRREDVRGWEIHKVKLEESVRVGAVVRAVGRSLGDRNSYYLSTARNELGVLFGKAEDGEGRRLEAVSWREMRDPVTGRLESRKVAKPI